MPENEIVIETGGRFIVYDFLVNPEYADGILSISLYVAQEDGVWKFHQYWDVPTISLVSSDPIVCYKLKLQVELLNGYKFPSVGIDWEPATFMVTSGPEVDRFDLTKVNRVNDYRLLPLRNSPTKIYRVYSVIENVAQEFEYKGSISRFIHTTLEEDEYLFDPSIDGILLKSTHDDGEVYCEYVIGGGAKALVPIEALDAGPMFDVDAGAIIAVHDEDLAKLPHDPDIEWQVVNNKELQGGYQYWDSEWIDLVAHRFNEDGEFKDGYYGSGVSFAKVGAAPDAFDADVANYSELWIGPNGEFVDKMWQTKCRGYVTFIGPPNKVIPPGIRVVAPKEIALEGEEGLGSRVPNGGMLPAQLVIKLNTNANTEFPSLQKFLRKTAAFKPRVMLYMREKTKYAGSTLWKAYGDDTEFGTASEHTGEPYWL